MHWQIERVRCRLLLLGILVALVACCFAQLAFGQITQREEVIALRAVCRQLKDPRKGLRSWRKGDPCTSNWTGVFCYFNSNDGYLHVQQLRFLGRNLSGTLAPELGRLKHVTILDFRFNNMGGSIPREIGNMTSLNLLLLGGNQISGPLPDELGYLPNITLFQLDLNNISGPLPKSFANLPKAMHFHMNNNSISGQIPPELHKLPQLIHLLLDNNNLSGYLPPELSRMPKLRILQVDNNNFEGTEIPESYTNMSNLLKLSLRNCKLQGAVPDFSTIPKLLYLDLSHNKLNGTIPTNRLYSGITTIDLSNNQLGGTIPSNFSGLPLLQNLSLENNFLSGDVPTDIWQNTIFASSAKLVLNFRNNALTDLAGSLNPPSNVTIMLEGNPICRRANELNIANSCGNQIDTGESPPSSSNNTCPSAYLCPVSGGYELVPDTPVGCNCSAPVGVGFLLTSPSISDFPPYFDMFRHYITSNLRLDLYQLQINTPFIWEKGHRLRLFLKFHPHYTENQFNETALQDLINKIAMYSIHGNDTFDDRIPTSSSMNKGVLAGIVLGSIACGGIIIMAVAFICYTVGCKKQQDQDRKKQTVPKTPMKIDGIKGFSFEELEKAASNFEIASQIGQGGYGKVYKGTLADGTVVAIKRAQQGSLQGQKEFFTEIELLSRLHHRNLVSLIGYCDEQSEQMLVYEFMANGSLRDLLSARHGSPLNFAARLRVALGSAKGILYLHTEADPPIIHRDIKASNILLDSKFNAKVSDFGISRLFPEADADASVSAHIFTYVKGTPGYVDPEYFQTHQLTEKSDVYSLGIVFLELLTGMETISHGKHIVQEVLAACRADLMFSIIDQSIGPYPDDCIKKLLGLALKCCEEEGEDRPMMLEVVRELENITATLPQSDIITPESDASSSATSGSVLSSIYGRDFSTSSNLQGSDLVSGVIPTIRPR
ncbi:probable LRR receptor-like serine/threonine-protein kinase At1g06840 isoform X2 [Punica granatum]|uniref:non-specific serine/threonine protein kinase n=1 Tax=Punica granatum TaxID=22663 RepID=A0A6P8BQA0_PUNGR|nr:probable LRR receptor-like serine/threonine-protein kinase At1g06840 isoform X2 [Punica granatum]